MFADLNILVAIVQAFGRIVHHGFCRSSVSLECQSLVALVSELAPPSFLPQTEQQKLVPL